MRLANIAQRAFNAPLLIDPAKAQAFLAGFGARILGGQIVLPNTDIPAERADRANRTSPRMSIIGNDAGDRRRRDGRALYSVRDSVAIIEATGTLVHRGAWLGESSGETSYEGLSAQIEAAAVDPMVRGIALEVDSFGGEAAGAFDLADLVRSARAAKPVWAFVAESALSAGYIIASQADRIIVPRTGEVGSIGVLTMHVDYSEHLDEQGVAVSLIYAGDHKVDGNPFEPLPDAVRDHMRAECSRLRELFAATVSAGRGKRLSAEGALATQARIYRGDSAVQAGLADEVSDLRSAFAAFSAQVNHRSKPINPTAARGVSKETTMSGNDTNENAEQTAGAAEPTTATAADTQQEQATTASGATAVPVAAAAISRTDAAALADISAQASRLGVTVDLAAALRDGTSPEQLRASVLEKAASAADASHVSTAHQKAASGTAKANGDSPLVAAAKKQAEAAKAARR